MEFMITIFYMMLSAYMSAFTSPLFLLVLFIVFNQYRRIVKMEKKLYSKEKNDLYKQILYAIAFGALGGLVASFLLLLFGISIIEVGIIYIWPLALLLLFVNPRFLCFAYAGGLVASASVIFRSLNIVFPVLSETSFFAGLIEINIPALMALIAILHLTESLLIATSGHLGTSPVYLKNRDGRVVGGLTMQKFWPLPLVALLATTTPEATQLVEEYLRMPDWWPLLSSTLAIPEGQVLAYGLFPIVAGLGYGDIAISTTPKEKKSISAKNLTKYSLLLLLFAILADNFSLLELPIALFAPLGHEYLIKIGNLREFEANPRFVSDNTGITILDVFPGSKANEAELVSGDKIITMNDFEIKNIDDFHYYLYYFYPFLDLGVLSGGRKKKVAIEAHARDLLSLGLIPAPHENSPASVELNRIPFYKRILKRNNR